MTRKILHLGPWGYNMTINNFYEVIKETPKGALVREIGSTVTRDTGYMSGYETPDPSAPRLQPDLTKERNADGSYPMKEKTFRVLKRGGEYRGSCGMHRTFTLDVVEVGQEFSFNHCD